MAERHRVIVEIPAVAGRDVVDAIQTAVADAAFDAEPSDRDGWDIFVYGDVVDDDDTAR